MLTPAPGASSPRLVRESVSGTASNASMPPSDATTVRQTPSTAIESPRSALIVVSISRRPPCMERTVPTSRTSPVNTSVPVDERLDRLADEGFELGALARGRRLELREQLAHGLAAARSELVRVDLGDLAQQLVVPELAGQPVAQ